MRVVMAVAAIGLAVLVFATAMPAPAAEQVGQVVLRYPDDHELSSGARAEQRWLVAEGCMVGTLAATERAALTRGLDHLRATLADPALQAFIAMKTDWAVPSAGDGWGIDPDAGARALRRLQGDRGTAVLDVLTYGSGPQCAVALASEATNAYSVPKRAVLLLRRPYLEAQLGLGVDGDKQLAATLIHEILHDVGFAHPDPADGLDAPAYLSSVPVYVGCVVRRWPEVGQIGARCGATPPSPRAGRQG